MTRVLITGAAGFIGAALTARLKALDRFDVRTAGRRPAPEVTHIVGDLAQPIDWRAALADVDTIVHLAGPAHTAISAELAERAIHAATAALAGQALAAGVSRFVYLSSIRACTDKTDGLAATETTTPRPLGAYARAKRAAEEALLAHAPLNPIVLRPPSVHAAHARGNWRRLMQLADSGAPLPFASLANRRSVIALASLVDAIVAVIEAPRVAGLFHVADEPAVSTAAMLRALRSGMGRPPRLFTAPAVARFAPAPLRESLEVETAAFRNAFAFAGVKTIEALTACGRDWAAQR
jgi:UDP-glucose 4-epimerase